MFDHLAPQTEGTRRSEFSLKVRVLIAVAIGIVCLGLAMAIVDTEKLQYGLANTVLEKLNVSGVSNPVTAVLLNFRSYDTLLELAVLLIVAVTLLPRLSTPHSPPEDVMVVEACHLTPVLHALIKWLVPIAILIGGYLLWTGASEPGGAFQAGSVIAGAGVLLCVVGRLNITWQAYLTRGVLVVGLLVFMLVALYAALATNTVLAFPVYQAGILILLIEVAATLSIAAILLLLFARLNAVNQPSSQEYTP